MSDYDIDGQCHRADGCHSLVLLSGSLPHSTRPEQTPLSHHTIYNVIRAIPGALKRLALDSKKAYLGIERRPARYHQLYSDVGFHPVQAEGVHRLLADHWPEMGRQAPSTGISDCEAVVAIIRIAGGNCRLLQRLLSQIENILYSFVARQLRLTSSRQQAKAWCLEPHNVAKPMSDSQAWRAVGWARNERWTLCPGDIRKH